ncbi:MAG: glucokinase, partial [Burkholderiales bacterium]
VYVAGGIAPKIIEHLKSGAFMRAFRDKAPYRALMMQIPVNVVLNAKVGLLGAARVACRLAADIGHLDLV